MITFPGSKVNLGLRITERLENGYHSLESIFIPIRYTDLLEIIPKKDNSPSSFYYSGLKIDGDETQNLVYKAWQRLSRDFSIPSIDVYLHKIVPMGGGIGGGSADASAMLKLLNNQFNLGIKEDKLREYAKELGADCPFFISNEAAYVEGIGELISPIKLDLSGYHFYLISPGIHINTREAFKNIHPKASKIQLDEIVRTKDITEWKSHIFNDFEEHAFKKHPELARIKESLYNKDAIYASMTGTGSAIYGIFEEKMELRDLVSSYQTYHQIL